MKLQPKVERIEENPSLFQDISLDETVVIILLDAKLQGVTGKVSFLYTGNPAGGSI